MKDAYAHLEDIHSASTKQLYTDQNKKSDTYFSDSTLDKFARELEGYSEAELRGLPTQYGKHWFWVERPADATKVKLIRSGKVILDLEDREESLGYWVPSPSGTLLIYGLSINGNEQTTLHVMDVEKGEDIDTPIPFAGFTDQGDIVWIHDKEFIYPRMNGFSKTGPEDKWLLGTKLYRHRIGSSAKDDVCIFGASSPETVMLTPTMSTDKAYCYVTGCEDELTHKLYVVELKTLKTTGIHMQQKSACVVKAGLGKVYVHTNYDASNYRLLMADENDLPERLDEWDEVLPESDDVLQDFWIHKTGAIVAKYSHNIASKLNIYDAYGNQDAIINLPPLSIVHHVTCSPDSATMHISLSGYTTPTTHLRMRSMSDDPEVVWQRQALPGDKDIHVRQEFAKSSDGTDIPFFNICKDLDADVPTIIYGYGGFNIALEPSYLVQFRPWILAGGRVVVANLRGGSEYGESWHLAGSMANKQHTFDDCIAVAEYLATKNFVSTEKLGVMGGSNGGLLVAAVTMQRPELFRAGAALVPLTDMLEFYKHQVAEFWVHEYGDPRIPEQRAWIEKWSPYHYPIDSAKSYPALYYETALHDARVSPFHAFKMVARMTDEVKSWKGLLLLRTWTDTGHQSSNLSKRDLARRTAEVYSFFAKELGL